MEDRSMILGIIIGLFVGSCLAFIVAGILFNSHKEPMETDWDV